jgi:pSer/pThr/pTyr-binding forkhead associated (FHA) protein
VTVDALSTDETLLVLKIAFLVLLYGFILLVVRTATKDLGGPPQESIVLGAAEAAALRAQYAPSARFVVLDGPALRRGSTIEMTGPTTVGRAAESSVRIDGDVFASARHARIDPRPDGVWVEDLGSTNGTFVNEARIDGARLLRPGDVVRIGQTELRLEQ